MARQAVTLAGAFIGAATGAPQLGFFLGSLVGNAIDPVRIKAPSIGDIAQQTSSEGVACPLYAGTAGGAGNLIYASAPDIVDGGTSSGKGAPEVENPDRAYITFIIRVGASLFDGPGYRQGITSLIKVWEDEKLVYDVSPTSTILEESAKYAEGFSFYPGNHTQLPDPDVEAIQGVGNTPSYRGRAIFVRKRYDMTDRRSVPNYRFEVSVNGTPTSSGATLISNVMWYSGNPRDLTLAGPDCGFTRTHAIVRARGDGLYAAGVTSGTSASNRFEITKFNTATQEWELLPPPADFPVGFANDARWHPTLNLLAVSSSGSGSPFTDCLLIYEQDGDTFTNIAVFETPPDQGLSTLAWDTDGSRLAIAQANTSKSVIVYDFVAATGLLANARTITGANFAGGWKALQWMPDGDYLACGSGAYLLVARDNSGAIARVSHANRDSQYGVFWLNGNDYLISLGGTPRGQVFAFDHSMIGSESVTYSSDFVTQPTGSIDGGSLSPDRLTLAVGAYGPSTESAPTLFSVSETVPPVVDRIGYAPLGAADVSAVSFSEVEQSLIEAGYTTFEQVVLATGRRVKLPDSIWNLPGLDAKVIRGVVVASQGYTAQDFLNSLRLLYPCDGSCHDGKIHILLRGGAVDVELDEQYLVDEDSDLEQEEVLRNGDDKRSAPLRRPARLNLMFPNANVGYALTKATPPNYGDRGDAVGETSVQVPAVLDEVTEAPQLADVLDKVGRADAEGEIVRVWPEYLAAKLVTGSVARLIAGELVRRTRVESIRRGDGTVRTLLRIDRVHALTSQATAQPGPGWPAPPPSLPGETEFAVLNSPGIINSDDAIGVRIAVSGEEGFAWRGTRIDYRVAGDTTWITLGTYTQRAVMGRLIAPLPAFSPYYTDYWHTLQAELLQDDDLEALSREQLLREGNPAAIVFPNGEVELLQFQTPTEVSAKRWDMTTLLRGRLGTTAGPHLAGARFVMLAGTVFVPLSSSLIGKNLQFRVTSIGNSPETAPVYDFTWNPAHCQREFAPVRLELERSGGTISGTWAARKRFGTDIAPIHSANFLGYRVTLTDGVTTTVLPDTTATSFSTSDAAFTGDITVTVQGLNRITGAGPGTSETI